MLQKVEAMIHSLKSRKYIPKFKTSSTNCYKNRNQIVVQAPVRVHKWIYQIKNRTNDLLYIAVNDLI